MVKFSPAAPSVNHGINDVESHSNPGALLDHPSPLLNGTAAIVENGDSDYATTSSAIAAFFHNRSIFVTGATGFLGKVLVEKLLRSCPGIRKIFVLVRPKKGKKPTERLQQELLASQVFSLLRNHNPSVLNKVVPVEGDLSAPCLGLSSEDESLLISTEVSVVFHSAATVNFQETLKTAVGVNLHGTLAVTQLCRKLTKLAACVHLSTAYANCEKSEILEEIYACDPDPEKILNAASWLSDGVMDKIFDQISEKYGKANTYVYTKGLAESLLQSHFRASPFPIAIVRPSIVGPTFEEPLPGWTDSVNGPVGLFLATGNGILRTVVGDMEKKSDVIPADFCINLMIAAAWKLGTSWSRNQGIAVYNFASGEVNPLTWGRFMFLAMNASKTKYPFETAIFYPTLMMTTSPTIHWINTFLFQIVPAYALDFITSILPKSSKHQGSVTAEKPKLVKIQQKLLKTQEALAYFSTREWNFRSKNVPALLDLMTAKDKKAFNFDVNKMDWEEYVDRGVLGCRTYFMRQDPSTIEGSLKKIWRLKMLNTAGKVSSAILLCIVILRMLRFIAAVTKGRLLGKSHLQAIDKTNWPRKW